MESSPFFLVYPIYILISYYQVRLLTLLGYIVYIYIYIKYTISIHATPFDQGIFITPLAHTPGADLVTEIPHQRFDVQQWQGFLVLTDALWPLGQWPSQFWAPNWSIPRPMRS